MWKLAITPKLRKQKPISEGWELLHVTRVTYKLLLYGLEAAVVVGLTMYLWLTHSQLQVFLTAVSILLRKLSWMKVPGSPSGLQPSLVSVILRHTLRLLHYVSWPSHPQLISLIMCKDYRLWRKSVCRFLQPVVTTLLSKQFLSDIIFLIWSYMQIYIWITLLHFDLQERKPKMGFDLQAHSLLHSHLLLHLRQPIWQAQEIVSTSRIVVIL
jgi:hypothetical protein